MAPPRRIGLAGRHRRDLVRHLRGDLEHLDLDPSAIQDAYSDYVQAVNR